MADKIVRTIHQIDADYKPVFEAMGKLNAEFGKQLVANKELEAEMNKLAAKEKQLLEARAKSQNPSAVVKYNNAIKEVQASMAKLQKSTESQAAAQGNVTKNITESSKAAAGFDANMKKAFNVTTINAAKKSVSELNAEMHKVEETTNDTDESVDKVASSMRELKQEYKAALSEAIKLGETTPAGQKALDKAGEIKDRIDDINQAAGQLASGSKFEQFGNTLGGVVSKIGSLDFGGAADQAQQLANISSKITFKEGASGLKALASSLGNVGVALLTNPLFLIGGTIALIGKAVYDLIKAQKSETDILNEQIELSKERQRIVEKAYDREIELAKAAGESTLALERQKLFATVARIREQLSAERRKLEITLGYEEQLAALQNRSSDFLVKKKREASKAVIDLEQELLDKETNIQSQRREAIFGAASTAVKAEGDKAKEIEGINKTAAEKAKARQEEEAARQKRIRDQQIQDEIDFNELMNNPPKQREEPELSQEERLKLFGELADQQTAIVDEAALEQLDIAKKKAEEEKRIEEEKTKAIIAGIISVVNAAFSATNQILSAKQKEVDGLINLQQHRVDEASKIAEEGNAELLEAEKKRLEDLNKEKEKFVRAQQALAVVQLITDTTIAVAKAAAEGGAAAPFTIAATLIALIAGLAQARQIASQAAFYEGGYTGDGNPRDVSTALGGKPYEYHKAEFVFDHKKTNQFHDIFNRVHNGEIDLNAWQDKVTKFDALNFANMDLMQAVALPYMDNQEELTEIKGLLMQLLYTTKTKGNANANIKFDKNGISAMLHEFNRVNSMVSDMAQ